ncbi:MAG: LysE family translocator [Acidiferrobacterales bacterium]|nr:LysE family translocator [Acidiferrobacterales bacterium]
MIDLSTYLLFIAASAALVIVPGPTVTVIVANSLNAGSRAGLLNVAGTQLGLGLMVLVLALGFASIVEKMAVVFDVVRFIGAIYLIWLGIKMWRSKGRMVNPVETDDPATRSGKGWLHYFFQGFLVIWSNPKALFFFGAFIPQFVDPSRDPIPQVLMLGATFMVVGTLLDGAYAVAAGQMRKLVSSGKVIILEKLAGCFLIGGGIWLAFSRR